MNKCNVADYEQILKEFERLGIERFVKRYRKYEALVGDSNSINFIETKIREYISS